MATGTVAGSRIFKVTLGMLVQQQNIQTGWYLRDTLLNNRSATDALATAQTFVAASMFGILPNDLRLLRLDALELTSKDYAQLEYPNQMGTGPGASSTSFLAVLMTLRSNQRARHRNGRMFLPLYGNPFNGSLDTGPRNAYIAFSTAFVQAFAGNALLNDFKAVVVAKARPANQNRPAIEHSWIDVETCRINTTVTALRRRKIGVGS